MEEDLFFLLLFLKSSPVLFSLVLDSRRLKKKKRKRATNIKSKERKRERERERKICFVEEEQSKQERFATLYSLVYAIVKPLVDKGIT